MGRPRIHKLKGSCSSAIRLQKQAKERLDSLLTRANKNRIGKKIRANDLIGYSLDLLTEEHLKDLVARRLTNKERLEIHYKQLSKTKRGYSREEFLGMLLDGKVAS
ncbi:MAG: hypothetical protein WCI18_15080 [Pseudomonadota bacterium]